MTSSILSIDGNSLDPIDAAAGDRLQLLVFGATWCGPCKAMAPAIDDVADSYAGRVAVAKIDIEASSALADSFGVRGVPTLVLRHGGQEVDRHVGMLTRTRLSLLLDDTLARGQALA
ncbi:thioredoxin family protein [Sphingomonas hankookensis]|uniref:thioredoxin family protein n=1 Tax=Sphingomonas hankookensis TaxID=563996 RepID=UPI001F56D4E5